MLKDKLMDLSMRNLKEPEGTWRNLEEPEETWRNLNDRSIRIYQEEQLTHLMTGVVDGVSRLLEISTEIPESESLSIFSSFGAVDG